MYTVGWFQCIVSRKFSAMLYLFVGKLRTVINLASNYKKLYDIREREMNNRSFTTAIKGIIYFFVALLFFCVYHYMSRFCNPLEQYSSKYNQTKQ